MRFMLKWIGGSEYHTDAPFYGGEVVPADEFDDRVAELVADVEDRTAELERLLNEALPFIAYAYSNGILGAECLGREIESHLNKRKEDEE